MWKKSRRKLALRCALTTQKRSYCSVCVIHICDIVTTGFENSYKKLLPEEDIVVLGMASAVQVSLVHLICAVVARMPLLNPKLYLRLLAALSNLQMVRPHRPWHLHEQEKAAWLFS